MVSGNMKCYYKGIPLPEQVVKRKFLPLAFFMVPFRLNRDNLADKNFLEIRYLNQYNNYYVIVS
jgi:hypothetical protein